MRGKEVGAEEGREGDRARYGKDLLMAKGTS